MKRDFPKEERKILDYWKEHNIFKKSVEQREDDEIFSFYDGPPFATGMPHYGHILVTAIKDAVLRFKTMQGYKVPRRVGWDCHGLPLENLIEDELELETKQDIEDYGIEKFNEACRNSVFRCVDDWERILTRVGRWADYSDYYATMNPSYTESIWWITKQLHDQGLIYKDYRVTPYCPRCGTPLSNFELNQPGAYQEIEDESVYIKFKLKDEEDTYLLVWTTTPWTLPANTAIAVGEDVDYVKVKVGDEHYILGEEMIDILEDVDYEIVEKLNAKDLEGKSYEPLYKRDLDKPGYKVVKGAFVSFEEGTGLVHTAPAFGEEDMKLGREEDLPIAVTVDLEGKIKEGMDIPGEGKFVKSADKYIKKDLKERDLLFKEEKIRHNYPHCWRCDTPLLYYPIDSWYVEVTKIKDDLVKNNKEKIHWVPEHLKEGRFGNWLEGAKDWSFSRDRYWGAPIPIWECENCENREVIGGREDLKEKKFSDNKYYFLRHGITNYQIEKPDHSYEDPLGEDVDLADEGREKVKEVAQKIEKGEIDVIYASDALRTKQTAKIVAEKLDVEIKFDKRLRDTNLGIFHGKKKEEYYKEFPKIIDRFKKAPEEGESWNEVRRRVWDAVLDIEEENEDKNILIVSHANPLWLLKGALNGLLNKEMVDQEKKDKIDYIEPGELNGPFEFTRFPYNREGELDFHKPFIDRIKFECPECGGKMERVEQVYDCWFESGSMPYAQWHYPFEKKEFVEKTFPANFIAEAVDQTRGWFYTLHVLATALTQEDIGLGKNQPAYENVVSNGLVLGEDGKKLSKSKKNFTPPDEVFESYGADALRYFLLSSTQMGEDYIFSKDRVEEYFKRDILTLWNCYKFFNIYVEEDFDEPELELKSELDKWILSRLNTLIKDVEKWMQDYHLTEASRQFKDFIDDFSNWYIRRSRRKLQKPESEKEKERTAKIYYHILLNLSKVMAPFTPFLSEDLYLKLNGPKESVHLENYPEVNEDLINPELEKKMKKVRKAAKKALSARSDNGIKVRQPLAKLEISEKSALKEEKELLEILKDEINVNEIKLSKELDKDEVKLDTEITTALKHEGMAREVIRNIQRMRKKAGYQPQDKVLVQYNGDEKLEEILNNFSDYIKKEGRIEDFSLGAKPDTAFDVEKEIEIENRDLWVGIKKQE